MSQSKRGGFLRDDSSLALVTSPFAISTASIPNGSFLAHRGAGALVAKDNALSSIDLLRAAAPSWPLIDGGDVRLTSDSQLVSMHSSLGTTTTDNTGAVASNTLAAVQAWNMLNFPYLDGLGSSTEHPPTFAAWLAKVKSYNAVCVCEPKVSGAVAPMITEIQNQAMTNRVFFVSFTAADLGPAKTAGMKVILLQDTTTLLTPTQISTAVNGGPPDYVAYDFTQPATFTAAWLAGLAAFNIPTSFFTTNRRAEVVSEKARIQAAGGLFGGFLTSNVPLWTSGYYSPLNSDPFADMQDTLNRGQIPSSLSSRQPYVLGGKLTFDDLTVAQWAHQGWGSRDAAPQAINFTITHRATSSDATRWGGICFGAADDRDVHEGAAAVSGGYYIAFVRQNGSMEISRRDNSTTAVALTGSPLATAAIPAGGSVPLRVEFIGTTVKFTRTDTGQNISAVDNTFRGGHFHFGKNAATSGLKTDFSAVTVTP